MLAFILAILAAAAPQGESLRRPIVRDGCQGEYCNDQGIWIVSEPIMLYAKPNAARPIATLRKGTRLTALYGVVVTTRIGTGVLTRPYEDRTAGGREIRAKSGTPIEILSDIGEGVVEARTREGLMLYVHDDGFEAFAEWVANDWVKVRLPSGRTGWIRHDDDESLDCSSLFEDGEYCKSLGAGPK